MHSSNHFVQSLYIGQSRTISISLSQWLKPWLKVQQNCLRIVSGRLTKYFGLLFLIYPVVIHFHNLLFLTSCIYCEMSLSGVTAICLSHLTNQSICWDWFNSPEPDDTCHCSQHKNHLSAGSNYQYCFLKKTLLARGQSENAYQSRL